MVLRGIVGLRLATSEVPNDVSGGFRTGIDVPCGKETSGVASNEEGSVCPCPHETLIIAFCFDKKVNQTEGEGSIGARPNS